MPTRHTAASSSVQASAPHGQDAGKGSGSDAENDDLNNADLASSAAQNDKATSSAPVTGIATEEAPSSKHSEHGKKKRLSFSKKSKGQKHGEKTAFASADTSHARVSSGANSDNPFDFSAPSTQEVQQRLNKLTLGVTVAVAITVFAVLFALWTAWSSYSQKVQLQNNVKTVIVASQDIKTGTMITSDMLAKKEVPEEYLGGGATSDASKLIGHIANIDISAQDAVSVKMVSGSGNTSSASAQLAKGEQAFSLSVSAEDGVSGTIAQGDTVDIISVYKGKTETLFSDKRVVALDALLSKRSSDYKSVVLALTPDEGKKLREYQNRGHHITLALNPKSAKADK